jgi:translation initiation factor eIF-2B subunit delta
MATSNPPPGAEPAKKTETSDAPPSQNKGKGVEKTKGQEGGPKADASKLTGAELKKQAKAEKAARRAQALLEKQSGSTAAPVPVVASGSGSKPEGQKGPKGQHRRAGSTAMDVRSLPVRGGAQKTVPVPDVPKEEDKTVEFFRHLYRNRTTSIAAAGKEVHPAVLALGLQMSNYTICGSCARLVATLQAFKRVSLPSMISELIGLSIGDQGGATSKYLPFLGH